MAGSNGIADALLVANDRDIVTGSVSFQRVPRKDQEVIVTLTKLEAA